MAVCVGNRRLSFVRRTNPTHRPKLTIKIEKIGAECRVVVPRLAVDMPKSWLVRGVNLVFLNIVKEILVR